MALKVKKEWQDLKVEGREKEVQKAEPELEMTGRQKRVAWGFGAGLVGLRETDVNAGSCKTKIFTFYSHGLTTIAWEQQL